MLFRFGDLTTLLNFQEHYSVDNSESYLFSNRNFCCISLSIPLSDLHMKDMNWRFSLVPEIAVLSLYHLMRKWIVVGYSFCKFNSNCSSVPFGQTYIFQAPKLDYCVSASDVVDLHLQVD